MTLGLRALLRRLGVHLLHCARAHQLSIVLLWIGRVAHAIDVGALLLLPLLLVLSVLLLLLLLVALVARFNIASRPIRQRAIGLIGSLIVTVCRRVVPPVLLLLRLLRRADSRCCIQSVLAHLAG